MRNPRRTTKGYHTESTKATIAALTKPAINKGRRYLKTAHHR